MIIINIGGEAEVPGAINVNSFVQLRRPLDEIARRGLVIGGDFTKLPLRSGCARAVVGNHLPLVGRMAFVTMAEAFRILRSGGSLRAYASKGGGLVLLGPMFEAGFGDIALAGIYAVGRKP